jgi:type IV secretory pathway TrbL component
MANLKPSTPRLESMTVDLRTTRRAEAALPRPDARQAIQQQVQDAKAAAREQTDALDAAAAAAAQRQSDKLDGSAAIVIDAYVPGNQVRPAK